MTSNREGAANLYRLTTRISESSDRPGIDSGLSLAVLLAPLGVEVVRTEPKLGTGCANGEAGPEVALINLTMPIDLPAIDYALRVSRYQVLELQQAGTRRPAGV